MLGEGERVILNEFGTAGICFWDLGTLSYLVLTIVRRGLSLNIQHKLKIFCTKKDQNNTSAKDSSAFKFRTVKSKFLIHTVPVVQIAPSFDWTDNLFTRKKAFWNHEEAMFVWHHQQ